MINKVHLPHKSYFWDLRKFSQGSPDRYKQTLCAQNKTLYIFKKRFPDIILRITKFKQKIHGWSFEQFQILQQYNNNPRVFHWKQVSFIFEGELIMSLLPQFNQYIIKAIKQAIKNPHPSLQKWFDNQIDDVFMLSSKMQTSFKNQHAFIYIQSLNRQRFSNHYQMIGWISDRWEPLLDMSFSQNIPQNGSYGRLLQDIDSFISKFGVINTIIVKNMFRENQQNKKKKEIMPTQIYSDQYEKKVLRKYNLFEYIQQNQRKSL